MPTIKKSSKAAKSKKPVKKIVVKKANKKSAVKTTPSIAVRPKTHTLYIESTAFNALNSADGYVDNFQNGRHTAMPNQSLVAPIVLPVGAVLRSLSIHYMNTSTASVRALFLRKHADRVSPSGEIEMSFITLPNGDQTPENYLTVTDDGFPDGGRIRDRFLHYLEIQGTGDFGADGKVTIRGISINYTY
jgi:hypothetical protein